MFIASEYGYVDVVSILIEYNADVNLKQEDGTTALILGTEVKNTIFIFLKI